MRLLHEERARATDTSHMEASAFICPGNEGIESKLMAHICATHLQNKHWVLLNFMAISPRRDQS